MSPCHAVEHSTVSCMFLKPLFIIIYYIYPLKEAIPVIFMFFSRKFQGTYIFQQTQVFILDLQAHFLGCLLFTDFHEFGFSYHLFFVCGHYLFH